MSVGLLNVALMSLTQTGGAACAGYANIRNPPSRNALSTYGVLDQHPWVVIGVHEERYRPPYSYTLGLTDRELPELVITGLPHKQAADALTRAAWDVLGGDVLAPGKRIRTVDGL